MPCPLVVTFVVTPVARFEMETVASGMAAPDSSDTVPERLPPTTCEYTGMDPTNQSISTVAGIQPTKKLSNLVGVLMMFILLIPPFTDGACSSIPDPKNRVALSYYFRTRSEWRATRDWRGRTMFLVLESVLTPSSSHS